MKQTDVVLWVCLVSHKMLKKIGMCGMMMAVMEMLIQSVVQNEAVRNEKMIRQYEALIGELPRGSLICRKKEYYYLKYREDGKVRDKYIGKDPDVVAEIRTKLDQRRHYSEMLAVLKREQKMIQKILEGFA